jgi:hypothetical protein
MASTNDSTNYVKGKADLLQPITKASSVTHYCRAVRGIISV